MGGDSGRTVAEASVIGCLMLAPDRCTEVFGMLLPEMFSDDTLGEIYSAASKLHEAEKPIDITTVTAAVGDASHRVIAECAEIAPHITRAVDYANIVREQWRIREVQSDIMEISMDASGQGAMMKDILPKLQRLVDYQQELENGIVEQSARPFRECVVEWLERYQRPPDMLKTGYRTLDRYLGGFQKKGLYVLSARPGEGKTDFALNLALKMSRQFRVNYNTLEMTRIECTERIISNLAKINSMKLREREADAQECSDIAYVTEALKQSPLIIDEQEKINAAEVKSKILKHHPELIILDNLQNMTAVQQRKNSWEAVADTTTMLKQIAKKYNVVILLIVQESREGGRSKRPAMDGLRGSSQIEADSDGIMFLRTEGEERWVSGDDSIRTKLHIVKNRHGGTGVCEFDWQPQYHRYVTVDKTYGQFEEVDIPDAPL